MDTSAETEVDTTTTSDGPHPGAPDEHCALDPARVYVEHTEVFGRYRLTDLEDPSIVCSFEQAWSGLLHPQTGAFITLRGAEESRRYLVEVVTDWLWPPIVEGAPWTTQTDTENDIVLGEVMFDEENDCRGEPDAHDDLVSDDTTIYASCGGIYFNAPSLSYRDGHPLVGVVDGQGISALGGYWVADAEGQSVEVAVPAGVDGIEHVAARPEPGALLAAIHVFRDDAITLERARVTPTGITLVGAYTHDIEDAGVTRFSMYAIAADGTLYGLGVAPGEDPDIDIDDADMVVVRLPIMGAPEVIHEIEWQASVEPPRLIGVGTPLWTPRG